MFRNEEADSTMSVETPARVPPESGDFNIVWPGSVIQDPEFRFRQGKHTFILHRYVGIAGLTALRANEMNPV